jgi:hypothetical protein
VDVQLNCPKCQHVFAIIDIVEASSVPCPQCGFQTPMPIAAVGVAQTSMGLNARGAFGFLSIFCGLCLLVCGFPLTLLFAMAMQARPNSNPRDFLTAEGMLVSALAFIGGGIFLLRRRGGRFKQYAALTGKAVMGLMLTLLVGVAAFIYAMASCFNAF